MRLGLKLCVMALATLFGEAAMIAGNIEGVIRARDVADSPELVVSVEDVSGTFQPPSAHAVVDQRGLRFIPHVLVILAGTTVDFTNSDPLLHNVFSISEAKRFNLGLYGRGTVRSIRFDQPGVVELLCNVHQEMSGYIVVLKNPFFAVATNGKKYRIENVPPGERRVRCWHPQLGENEVIVHVPENGNVTADCELRPSQ